jgi:hypothetical protein
MWAGIEQTPQFGGRGDDKVRDSAPVTVAAMLGKQPLDLQRPVHRRLADRQLRAWLGEGPGKLQFVEPGLAAPQPQAHGGEMGPVALRGVAPRARRVPPKGGTGICDLPSCCSDKPCASRDLLAGLLGPWLKCLTASPLSWPNPVIEPRKFAAVLALTG